MTISLNTISVVHLFHRRVDLRGHDVVSDVLTTRFNPSSVKPWVRRITHLVLRWDMNIRRSNNKVCFVRYESDFGCRQRSEDPGWYIRWKSGNWTRRSWYFWIERLGSTLKKRRDDFKSWYEACWSYSEDHEISWVTRRRFFTCSEKWILNSTDGELRKTLVERVGFVS